MIFPFWTAFRDGFNPGGATDPITAITVWPLSSVRANGFGGAIQIYHVTFSAPALGFAGWPLLLSVNNFAQDASPPTDDYDWYVSQRTDDVASQPFQVVRYVYSSPSGYSGSIRMNLNNTSLNQWIVARDINGSNINDEAVQTLLKNVHVYCRRKSDGAIDMIDLVPSILKPI